MIMVHLYLKYKIYCHYFKVFPILICDIDVNYLSKNATLLYKQNKKIESISLKNLVSAYGNKIYTVYPF